MHDMTSLTDDQLATVAGATFNPTAVGVLNRHFAKKFGVERDTISFPQLRGRAAAKGDWLEGIVHSASEGVSRTFKALVDTWIEPGTAADGGKVRKIFDVNPVQ